jgi:hypothetical protein
MKKLLASLLLLTFFAVAQTAPVPTPGVASTANAYQAAFDTAYYASRPPQFQPLYYGRPGVTVPQGQGPLTQTQFNALIASLVATPPTNPTTGQPFYIIEQIECWGMDPYTVELWNAAYGNTYFPPGAGNVTGSLVITPGQYSGPVPLGDNPVVTNLALLTPWPSTTPTTAATPTTVGPAVPGTNLFEILGPIPPVGTLDTSGKYTVVAIPQAGMFATGTPTYYWQPVAN